VSAPSLAGFDALSSGHAIFGSTAGIDQHSGPRKSESASLNPSCCYFWPAAMTRYARDWKPRFSSGRRCGVAAAIGVTETRLHQRPAVGIGSPSRHRYLERRAGCDLRAAVWRSPAWPSTRSKASGAGCSPEERPRRRSKSLATVISRCILVARCCAGAVRVGHASAWSSCFGV